MNRPHPWGLLVTFIELIKNPIYNFWSHDFVHCAPEIERLFETVARSCNQGRTLPQTSTAQQAGTSQPAPPSTPREAGGDIPTAM